MRYGIISDVHANAPALEAVFRYVEQNKEKIDGWWFLGDAVGYGPFPLDVIRSLRQKVDLGKWKVGNHDAAFVGLLDLNSASDDATFTLRDHLAKIQKEEPDLWEWCLNNWTQEKATRSLFDDEPLISIWLSHGTDLSNVYSFRNDITRYLFPWPESSGGDLKPAVIEKLHGQSPHKSKLLLHGHTHIPYALGIRVGQTVTEYLPIQYDNPIILTDFEILLINPGSVGLPRHADPEPHADFGILDLPKRRKPSFKFCRVTYDPSPVFDEMWRLNYPESLKLLLEGAHPENTLWSRKGTPWEWVEWNRKYRWHDSGWSVIS